MKTIFVGPLGGGKTPDNGASIKNYHILNKLKTLIPQLKVIDTENWKRNPLVLIRLLCTIITHRRAKYILSLNNGSADNVIRILNTLAPDADVIYWVIGGSLAKWINEGRLSINSYRNVRNIIVEGESMRRNLKALGLRNVSVMPNFKKIVKLEVRHKRSDKLKFVFLSRIIPQKGCDLIFEASDSLYKEGYVFDIDFFGPVEESYRQAFNQKVDRYERIHYKGFLDLRNEDNYKILAGYDAFLFPTFWPGEGCPGIVMDAYMAGLPILASDWNLNSDYVKDGITGLLYEPENPNALKDAMKACLSGNIDLNRMSQNAYDAASGYDMEFVLSKEELVRNHII